jgi:protoheme IX farnesyltransferase
MMADSAAPTDLPIADLSLAEFQLGTARDFFALLKPRVVVLVVFTGAVGLIVAPGHINPLLAAVTILCIAIGAGAAGAINMWYDRDIDAVMRRTAKRPIPAGRIAPESALGFGVFLSCASVLLLGLATNIAAGLMLAVSIAFYVLIYTVWLKRRTAQNIVIGGAAGAFPPIIGWLAVTGHLAVLPLLLFAIVFFWTPPHFWALSLFAHADYERAGVPMLPVVAGARSTRRHVLAYTVLLVGSSLSPWLLGYAGPLYGISAAALGAVFLFHAWRVFDDDTDETGVSLNRDASAKACFKYSISYLFVLFTAMAVDRLIF